MSPDGCQIPDRIVLQFQRIQKRQAGKRSDVFNQVVGQIQAFHCPQILKGSKVFHPVAAEHQERELRHVGEHTDVPDLIVP